MPSVLQRVRYLVLESLYEAEASGHDPLAVFDRRLAEESGEDPRIGEERTANWGRGIIRSLWPQRQELDEIIGTAATRYPVETLAAIDRNILRLAIWELRDDASSPAAAVINEAVELARRYGGERSPAFVHGVLGTVSRRLRPAERGDPAPS